MSTLINTFIVKIYFLLVGIKFGKNFICVSIPRILFIDSKKSNLIIGDNIIFSGKIEIKIKNLSKIILGNNVKIDQGVRLIASNGSKLEIKNNSKIMFNSQINAGTDIKIGSYSALSAHSTLTSSSHIYKVGKKFLNTGYVHKKIIIGDNVHIGIGSFVSPGIEIVSNVIVGPLSYVNKDLLVQNTYYNGNPIKRIYTLEENS